MTVREALELLMFEKLECDNYMSCEECPYQAGDGGPCWEDCAQAARTIKDWLSSLPEGRLLNITLEDLL